MQHIVLKHNGAKKKKKKKFESLINRTNRIQKINHENFAGGAKVTAVPCLII